MWIYLGSLRHTQVSEASAEMKGVGLELVVLLRAHTCDVTRGEDNKLWKGGLRSVSFVTARCLSLFPLNRSILVIPIDRQSRATETRIKQPLPFASVLAFPAQNQN